MSGHRHAIITLITILLLAPIAAAADGTGGGSVRNKAPTIGTIATTAGDHNANEAYEFEGVIEDRNGEADLVGGTLSVAFTTPPTPSSPAALPSARTFGATSSADYTATAEPSCTSSGTWHVWNPASSPGTLNFKLCYTYNKVGTYEFVFTVSDGTDQGTQTVTKTVKSKITYAMVTAAGAADTNSWGNWIADPAQATVPGTNYFRVENTGATAAQQFTIQFDGANFVGGNGQTIAIHDKIKFSYWQDTEPGTAPDTPSAALSASLFQTQASNDADGAITLTFTGVGDVWYVSYTLFDLPDFLKDQAYTQGFTVSAL